jgi:hypothetical protein
MINKHKIYNYPLSNVHARNLSRILAIPFTQAECFKKYILPAQWVRRKKKEARQAARGRLASPHNVTA